MLFLAIYLTGALLFAARLGWHVATKLDEYHWRFARENIVSALVWMPVFWPLSLLNPLELARQLLNPARLFEQNDDVLQLGFRQAEHQRAWDALRANPPKCGHYIRHHHVLSITGKMGSLVTVSADIAEAFEWKRLEDRFAPLEDPHHGHQPPQHQQYYQAALTRDISGLHEEDGAFLQWLADRDDTITAPIDIPALWDGFSYQAEALARAGQAEVFCLQCQRVVPPAELSVHDEHDKRGWNHNITRCSQGHTVLRTKGMHFYFG